MCVNKGWCTSWICVMFHGWKIQSEPPLHISSSCTAPQEAGRNMVSCCPPKEHWKVAEQEEGSEGAPCPGDEKRMVCQTNSAALEEVHCKQETVWGSTGLPQVSNQEVSWWQWMLQWDPPLHVCCALMQWERCLLVDLGWNPPTVQKHNASHCKDTLCSCVSCFYHN